MGRNGNDDCVAGSSKSCESAGSGLHIKHGEGDNETISHATK